MLELDIFHWNTAMFHCIHVPVTPNTRGMIDFHILRYWTITLTVITTLYSLHSVNFQDYLSRCSLAEPHTELSLLGILVRHYVTVQFTLETVKTTTFVCLFTAGTILLRTRCKHCISTRFRIFFHCFQTSVMLYSVSIKRSKLVICHDLSKCTCARKQIIFLIRRKYMRMFVTSLLLFLLRHQSQCHSLLPQRSRNYLFLTHITCKYL